MSDNDAEFFNFDDDLFEFDDSFFDDDYTEYVLADTETKQKNLLSYNVVERQLNREELEQLVKSDEYNEIAWLWLAMFSENPAEQEKKFKKVLEINPFNLRAHIALRTLPNK